MNNFYFVKGYQLTAITNALRKALGTSDTFRSTEIPAKILEIGKNSYSSDKIIVENPSNIDLNADYLISTNELKAIADAIRIKLNTTTTYTVDEIPHAINSIYLNRSTSVSSIENI